MIYYLLATDTSMSMSTSAADESDMDIFEDAIESQEDEMGFEEHVKQHSANHTGVMPATPPPPPIQFQFSPVPMLNTSPSTSNVTIDTTLLNERQPSICAHEECGPIIKHMAVEVDRSAQLCGKVYELTDISKHRLQREKNRAKAAIEEVEKRAVERDGQWKKHLAESLSKQELKWRKGLKTGIENGRIIWSPGYMNRQNDMKYPECKWSA